MRAGAIDHEQRVGRPHGHGVLADLGMVKVMSSTDVFMRKGFGSSGCLQEHEILAAGHDCVVDVPAVRFQRQQRCEMCKRSCGGGCRENGDSGGCRGHVHGCQCCGNSAQMRSGLLPLLINIRPCLATAASSRRRGRRVLVQFGITSKLLKTPQPQLHVPSCMYRPVAISDGPRPTTR